MRRIKRIREVMLKEERQREKEGNKGKKKWRRWKGC